VKSRHKAKPLPIASAVQEHVPGSSLRPTRSARISLLLHQDRCLRSESRDRAPEFLALILLQMDPTSNIKPAERKEGPLSTAALLVQT
jgi:hypothetical protein